MIKYYLDACIWLNMLKKEGDPSKGLPYWQITIDFTDKTTNSSYEEIIYSAPVMRKVKYKLKNDIVFRRMERLVKINPTFRFVDLTKEDKEFARTLESRSGYEISFFDCLHMAICKRLDAVFVTRDKKLIKFARTYITADKPEDISTY